MSQVTYLIVDDLHNEHPDLVRDQYWDSTFPELPYTAVLEEAAGPENPFVMATATVEIPEEKAQFVEPPVISVLPETPAPEPEQQGPFVISGNILCNKLIP